MKGREIVSNRILVVSGDGHVGAEPSGYIPYLDEPYREALATLEKENAEFVRFASAAQNATPLELRSVVDGSGVMKSGVELGGWDFEKRIEEMDREGIAAEVMIAGHGAAIQPFFSVVNNPYPADLRAAGARAYHRWLADAMTIAPDRLTAVGEPGPCLNLEETIQELRWIAAHGFRSVALPRNTADPVLPELHDDYYEPFWEACSELGLILSVHAGWGNSQGQFAEFVAQFTSLMVGGEYEPGSAPNDAMMNALANADDSPLKLDMGPRRALWQLMLGGVFDRHPDLRLVLTEVRADWVPATLAHLDARVAHDHIPLRLKPSEYWEQNCRVTPSSIHMSEIELRHEIGIEQMMFGVDFPHPESTWPNTQDWIRTAFKGVPESEARAILGENAVQCYGFDHNKLERIAERIGPLVDDVLYDTEAVDSRLVENFHQRAGLNRPAEVVDIAELDSLFDADIQAISNRPAYR
jgi:predicted TIM-barrel fold metal-dependent hydrolase